MVEEEIESTDSWPIEGATVKLAHNPRAPKEEGEDAPFHVPPTENGRIIIGMDVVIFLPSRAVQEIGFTPYKLIVRPKEGGATDETEVVPVDATRELMAHYSGIYKMIQ